MMNAASSDGATPLSDEELTAAALSFAPTDVAPPGGIPWRPGANDSPDLPEWYMPQPMVGGSLLTGWRRVVAWVIIASFIAVVTAGLCSTYGQELDWFSGL